MEYMKVPSKATNAILSGGSDDATSEGVCSTEIKGISKADMRSNVVDFVIRQSSHPRTCFKCHAISHNSRKASHVFHIL